MTSQNATLELFYGGVWNAVPLYLQGGMTIERTADFPRATKVTCEVNNDSLAYDPARPESPLYGLAGRNTRARLVINGHTRVFVEASEWKPKRTSEHKPGVAFGRSAVDLTAEGLLRRLDRWTDPLRSPMFRTISTRSTSIGHWPLEDEREAGQASSTAGTPAYTTGVTFGADESPQGAARTVQMKTGSLITGAFDPASTTAGWQVAFSMRLPAVPVGPTYTGIMNWSTSNGYRWFWNVNDTTYQFQIADSDGTIIKSSTVLFGGDANPDQWVTFRVKATQSGGTVTFEPAWYSQNGTVWGFTDTYAGTVGALRQFRQVGSTVNNGGWVSHIFAVTGATDNLLSGAALRTFDGYLGERAGDRFLRLCSENGVTRYMTGSAADTQPMGPQRPDTFLALLQEIADTDDSIIFDERFDVALTLRTRRSMAAQTAVLNLAYPSQVAPPLVRVIGDKGTHNRVTVKNAGGGEFTAALTTGRMSVAAPPAGVGEYKQTVDVNVAEESTQLEPLARWHLAKGTVDRTQYSQVTVDLLANPGLAASCMFVNLGDMITITGAERDVIPLRVVGIEDSVGPGALWSVTYTTEPYEAWAAGRYDAATSRYDVAGSTLGVARDAVQTAFTLSAATRDDLWSTTSTPYDLMIAGERVTVTAMGAAAGAGPFTQAATVTRSINGVVKVHAVGEEVHIATPGRYAL